MKDPKPRNFVLREMAEIGIGGIIRRKNLVALALDRGIPENRINKAIYDLIAEEALVIASQGMYAIRATKKEIGVEPEVEMPYENALSVQVGGDHYESKGIQPIVFITRAKLSFIQGNIIKYAFRAYRKNGIQDVYKCLHYAQLAIELKHYAKIGGTWNKYMAKFIDSNELDDIQSSIVKASCFGRWKEVIEKSLELKSSLELQVK